MSNYLPAKSTSSKSGLLSGLPAVSMWYGVVPEAPVRCDGEFGLIRGTCSRSSDGLYGVTICRGGCTEKYGVKDTRKNINDWLHLC